MTVLLVTTAWILTLTLIVGLCAAARIGDLAQPAREAEMLPWQADMLAGEDGRTQAITVGLGTHGRADSKPQKARGRTSSIAA
jgi:hypothetical protein